MTDTVPDPQCDTRVIGVGNPWRRDDGVGLEVAAALREKVPAGVEVMAAPADGAGLLEACEGARCIYFVDALRGTGAPGVIHRLDDGDLDGVTELFGPSSHGAGLGQALALGRALGRLPPRVVVYAVEGADFSAGGGLSAMVADAVPQVCAQLLAELEAPRPKRPG